MLVAVLRDWYEWCITDPKKGEAENAGEWSDVVQEMSEASLRFWMS